MEEREAWDEKEEMRWGIFILLLRVIHKNALQ